MTTRISIQEAQTKLPELIHDLREGVEVVITEQNQPVARLLPAAGATQRTPRQPGTLRGTVQARRRAQLEGFRLHRPGERDGVAEVGLDQALRRGGDHHRVGLRRALHAQRDVRRFAEDLAAVGDDDRAGVHADADLKKGAGRQGVRGLGVGEDSESFPNPQPPNPEPPTPNPLISAPQPPQNFSPAVAGAAHEGHATESVAPHSVQKRRSGRLSWSQDGQRIACVLACGN